MVNRSYLSWIQKVINTSENENTLAFLKTGETIHIRYIEMKDVNIIKNVGE